MTIPVTCVFKDLTMTQSASSVSADPCGVSPVWVDGLPAVKTSKGQRPGCPAESPAPPVEPNSVYWTSVLSADNTLHIDPNSIFFSFGKSNIQHQISGGEKVDRTLNITVYIVVFFFVCFF